MQAIVVKPFNTLNRRFKPDDIIVPADVIAGSAMSFADLKDGGFIKITRVDYDAMTRAELDAIAAERGLDTTDAKTKADVVALIQYAEKAADAVETGKFDALHKADLEKLAAERGLDISGAKTKADLVALLQSTEVESPHGTGRTAQ